MSNSGTKKTAPYGSWPSPIDAKMVIGGNCKNIWELQVHREKQTPFWVEQTFPTGRRVLFAHGKQKPIQWSPDGVSVSNSVHEYGGGSFCLGDHGRVFVCHNGGISELVTPGADPQQIIQNSPGQDFRHADLFFHGNSIYAVQERHEGGAGKEPKNCLIRVDVDKGGIPELIAEGADFYAAPRISQNGNWLAWIQWNKPYMPWDLTSVCVMKLKSDGTLDFDSQKQVLTGCSYFGLQWSASGKLFVVGEPTGFWNVYQLDPDEGFTPRNIYEINKEIGGPLWNFADDRPFTILAEKNTIVFAMDGRIYIKTLSNDEPPKAIVELEEMGFSVYSHLCSANSKVYALAAGPTRSRSVIEVDVQSKEIEVIREARSSTQIHSLPISIPILETFDSDGCDVQGYFYPPTNSEFEGPGSSNLPPVLFLAHGGPTACTTNALELKIQFFTSRGWAVFDINYRGSTGRGREFRDMLLGNMGIVDRDDMINGAYFLINKGLVDPKKVCIMGSSAGGFVLYSTLFDPRNPFAAAVSVYGVADLEDITKVTHKFEASYNDRLVAPYPECAAVYRERSAIHNLEKIRTPIALLHGTADPVVPCHESEILYEALKAKGVPTLLRLFPGEGHGFKSADAITQTYEISYCFLCRIVGISPSINIENLQIDNFQQQ